MEHGYLVTTWIVYEESAPLIHIQRIHTKYMKFNSQIEIDKCHYVYAKKADPISEQDFN